VSRPRRETRSGGALARGSAALILLLVFAPLRPAAGQWVSEPGQGWVQVSVFHQQTRTEFNRNRDRDPLDLDGEAVNTVVFVTLNMGLAPGVDFWIQAPWQRVAFNDVADDRVQKGFGDTRVWLRVAPLQYLGSDFPLAVRGGGKFAVSDFRVDSEVISLTDGQRDWEVMLELGKNFWPRSLWIGGWAGFRWREENEEIRREFGDQAFFLVQAGGQITDRLGWKFVGEGFDGKIPNIEGLDIRTAERELFQVTPWLNYQLGPGQVEVGGQIPLFGRNQLAGPSLVVGYFTGFEVPWFF